MSHSSTDSFDSQSPSVPLLVSSSSAHPYPVAKRRRDISKELQEGISAWMSSTSPDKARHSPDQVHGKNSTFDEPTSSPAASDRALVEAREDLGASKSEAAVRVFGKYSRWVLYIRYVVAIVHMPPTHEYI